MARRFKTQAELDRYLSERKVPQNSIYWGCSVAEANRRHKDSLEEKPLPDLYESMWDNTSHPLPGDEAPDEDLGDFLDGIYDDPLTDDYDYFDHTNTDEDLVEEAHVFNAYLSYADEEARRDKIMVRLADKHIAPIQKKTLQEQLKESNEALRELKTDMDLSENSSKEEVYDTVFEALRAMVGHYESNRSKQPKTEQEKRKRHLQALRSQVESRIKKTNAKKPEAIRKLDKLFKGIK